MARIRFVHDGNISVRETNATLLLNGFDVSSPPKLFISNRFSSIVKIYRVMFISFNVAGKRKRC